MDWGQAPANPEDPGPGEFNTVHSIAISADRRLYVVDRAHARIQIFNEDGTFLDMFSTGPRASSRPYAHEILRDRETGEEFIWVADGGTHRILKYDLDGNYLYGWGGQGGRPGQFNGPHSLTVDPDGNLYTAEVFAGRVQKFVPRPGADPAKLAGHQLRQLGLNATGAPPLFPWTGGQEEPRRPRMLIVGFRSNEVAPAVLPNMPRFP